MKNNSKPTNIRDALTFGTTLLRGRGIESARLDTLLLLEHHLNASRAWLLSHPEGELHPEISENFLRDLRKRSKQQPMAYILGHKEFYGRNFIIEKSVLVPRPESEDVVELALLLAHKDKPLQVLDLGTGSGCLGITIQLERPKWRVTLSDIDAVALGIAHKNARKFQIDNKVSYRRQDLLHSDTSPYDLVVANLPYVPSSIQSKPDLQAEPKIALFSGRDGLSHYRSLFSLLQRRKHHPLFLITESLTNQHQQIENLAKPAGYTLKRTLGLAQLFIH